jgi:hypothetical protein
MLVQLWIAVLQIVGQPGVVTRYKVVYIGTQVLVVNLAIHGHPSTPHQPMNMRRGALLKLYNKCIVQNLPQDTGRKKTSDKLHA